MLKRPLIVGNKGNMGRRYAAILDLLEVDHIGMDIEDFMPPGHFDSIIIATPTASHAADLLMYSKTGVPILCEKPLAKSSAEIDSLLEKIGTTPLRMVNQYEFLNGTIGPTSYDCWNHGKDGLAWDCINILGLARGDVYLGETSPIWDCWINGRHLQLGEVDKAYVHMIQSWLGGSYNNIPYIRHAHKAVEDYLCRQKA